MRLLVLLLCPLLVLRVEATDWSKIKSMDLKIYDGDTTRNELEGRIIGGEQAELHQFPYQVGIIVDDTYLCGGSLISTTVVLTAAHCTSNYESWEVYLAAHDIMAGYEPDRQVVMATHAVTHEDFNLNGLIINDIALVMLPDPVSGIGIDVLRLPTRSQQNLTYVGEIARISGWGKTSDEMLFPSPILNYVDMSIVVDSNCTNYGQHFVAETMLCVSSSNGTANTCNGDSGGPLVLYDEEDALPVQIGIVSYGNAEGCESKKSVVFTQVNAFLDWIEQNGGVIINP